VERDCACGVERPQTHRVLDGNGMQRVLTYVVIAVAVTGCAESDVETPAHNLCIGSAVVTGVVRDFDGIPLGGAGVEFTIGGTGGPTIIGQAITDKDGSFGVELHAADTKGEQLVSDVCREAQRCPQVRCISYQVVKTGNSRRFLG
jgi:hypothetical protein